MGKQRRKRYQITSSQDIFSGDQSRVSPVCKGVNLNEERDMSTFFPKAIHQVVLAVTA